MKAFLFLMAFALNASAADGSPSTMINNLEGVYKHRFMNGIINSGNQPKAADTYYQAEDVVEIVRHNDTHIYFRAELNFYNGHTCSIAGLAGYQGNKFVYHDPEKAEKGEQSCTLTITQTADAVKLTDSPGPNDSASCHAYCGARGSLSDISIAKKSRRPIRYLPRLLRSEEYRKAIADLKAYQSRN